MVRMASWNCAGRGLLREVPRRHESRKHREDAALLGTRSGVQDLTLLDEDTMVTVA